MMKEEQNNNCLPVFSYNRNGQAIENQQVKTISIHTMKKNLQIHVRVTPTTRQRWDELNENSPFNTQSALFRHLVEELYKNEINNLKTENDD